jgi:hypothetical protein
MGWYFVQPHELFCSLASAALGVRKGFPQALLCCCMLMPCAASLEIEYPMLFKVANRSTGHSTHCSVLEFVAQEGNVYLPRWVSVRRPLGGGC